MQRKLALLSLMGILLLGAFTSVFADESNISTSWDGLISIDPQQPIVENYLGLGIQWNVQDEGIPQWSKDQFSLIERRVDFYNPGIARVMIQRYEDHNNYVIGLNRVGKPIYDWETQSMKQLYDILDYLLEKGVPVMLGEWGPPGFIESPSDLLWAEMIGESLEYLVKNKGYKNIVYYNIGNEPNFWTNEYGLSSDEEAWELWKQAVENLNVVLKRKGLDKQVSITGPDSVYADHWMLKSVNDIPLNLGGYEIHKYATVDEIENGQLYYQWNYLANYLRTSRTFMNRNVPFYISEAGIRIRDQNKYDQQNMVYSFDYGLHMSDYVIQSMQAGLSGIIPWNLDDSMHWTPDGAKTNEFKVWGFWNSLGDDLDRKIRPWFYPMSIFSNLFPNGSMIIKSSFSGTDGVRASAAILGKDGNQDLSIALVNNNDQSKHIHLNVSGAKGKIFFTKYLYSQDAMPTDFDGFAIPYEVIRVKEIGGGLNLTIPGNSVIFLTTKGSKTHKINFNENDGIAFDYDQEVFFQSKLNQHYLTAEEGGFKANSSLTDFQSAFRLLHYGKGLFAVQYVPTKRFLSIKNGVLTDSESITNQSLFRLQPADDGDMTIRSRGGGYTLKVERNSALNIRKRTVQKNIESQFTIRTLPLNEEIWISAADNFIGVDNSTGWVQAGPSTPKDAQRFIILGTGEGLVSIKSDNHGFMTAMMDKGAHAPISAIAQGVGEWEKFRMYLTNSNRLIFVSTATQLQVYLSDNDLSLEARYPLNIEKSFSWGE